jgi:hypothetical protein
MVPVRDGEVVDLDRGLPPAARPRRASTIVSTLWRTMPGYVPSGVPGPPIASEKSSPPISTSKPRARTASCTARIVWRGTDDSTKIAGISSSAM